jgi:hypothetical protein
MLWRAVSSGQAAEFWGDRLGASAVLFDDPSAWVTERRIFWLWIREGALRRPSLGRKSDLIECARARLRRKVKRIEVKFWKTHVVMKIQFVNDAFRVVAFKDRRIYLTPGFVR